MAGFISTLVACSSTQVKTAQDPGVNLANYKTFAWAPMPASQANNPSAMTLDQNIKANVNKGLIAKGLSETDPAHADLLVSYTAMTKNNMNFGSAPTPGIWSQSHETGVNPGAGGSLTLQFTDAHTHRPVWAGTAPNVITDVQSSQNEVASAVQDILKKYPLQPVA